MNVLASDTEVIGATSAWFPLPPTAAPGTVGVPVNLATVAFINTGQTEAYVAIGARGLTVDDTGTAVAAGSTVSIDFVPGSLAWAAIAPGGVTVLTIVIGN